MEQHGDCASSLLMPGSDVSTAPAGQRMLDLPTAWQFSRGEGQTVAVIDTGVRPGPRLGTVDPGGDYIGTTDGLTDCDGHGTLVAGIVAGQPGDDGFAGVAPAARLLALRTASAISPRLRRGRPRITPGSFDVAGVEPRDRARRGPRCTGHRRLDHHLPAR